MIYEKKLILKYELICALFMIIIGSFLHFTYKLSDYNFVVSLFSATNESMWEHLKLGFFSMIFFFPIEFFTIYRYSKNFFTGKLISALFLMIFLILMCNLGLSLFNRSILFYDISIYVLGCIISQLISFFILSTKANYPLLNLISLIIMFFIVCLFAFFTLNRPNVGLFKIPN